MESTAEKSRAAFLSLATAALLTAMKGVVGVLTGSLGILSEALHSVLDLVAALLTCVSVGISGRPADGDHNFGHGKVENLTALAEATLLLATCAWIVWEAVSRLASGASEVEVTLWSYAVVLVSIAADFARSRSLMRTAKKYRSQALEADAIHFSTDILSSFVVLLGLVCASFGEYWVDSVAALGVAAAVAWVSLRLSVRAVDNLLDKAPAGLRRTAEDVLRAADGVRKWHDLRVRSAGADYEIDVNIHVDKNLSIVDAHSIAERVELELKKIAGGSSIVNIHTEPDS